MESRKTIFAQLMDFLPIYEFNQCVPRYHGHYEMESFSVGINFSASPLPSLRIEKV